MSENQRSLDPTWRDQVQRVGKRAFENDEMLRLGFVTPQRLAELERSGVTQEEFNRSTAELAEALDEIKRIDKEVAELSDIEAAISEIRARRIARVRAERAERRARRALETLERKATISQQRREAPTYLGRGVSNRLNFTGGDPEKLASNGLPVCNSFLDIASELQIEPQALQWLTYERGAGQTDHYTRFEIPKRSGGKRLISSPKPTLRAAQVWVRERVLLGRHVHPAATAFRKGASIVDNAAAHSDSRVVLRMDLKDFFPSITFPRVRGYFESLGYNPGVASVFALICTDAPRVLVTRGEATHVVALGERSLPQGACTSPDLANLITLRLDQRLSGLSAHSAWTYTRYADDLVFSSSAEDAAPQRIIRTVTSIVRDEGFTINEDKTCIMRSPHRQMVTGLIVNNGVRLSRRDLRRIRAFLHQCEARGLDAVSEDIGKQARAVAQGYCAYVHMVSPGAAARLREKHPWIA